jgi:hypothetical protein
VQTVHWRGPRGIGTANGDAARRGARAARDSTSGAGAPAKAASGGAEAPKKKNLRLHQSKIDEARAIPGTCTETETIETALDLVVFRRELVDGARAMRGAALHNLFDGEA